MTAPQVPHALDFAASLVAAAGASLHCAGVMRSRRSLVQRTSSTVSSPNRPRCHFPSWSNSTEPSA